MYALKNWPLSALRAAARNLTFGRVSKGKLYGTLVGVSRKLNGGAGAHG